MSTIYLGIDPGARKTGCAIFMRSGWAKHASGTELHAAAVVKNPLKPADKAGHVAECLAMAQAVKKWVERALHQPGLANDGIGGCFEPEVIIFEWPRVYLAGKQKGDQNDLLPMPGVDCAVAALFPEAEHLTITPDTWKHQVSKEIMNARVWDRLSPEEQARVERLPRGGLSHDCLDACGLVLHHVGRLERHRVFA